MALYAFDGTWNSDEDDPKVDQMSSGSRNSMSARAWSTWPVSAHDTAK